MQESVVNAGAEEDIQQYVWISLARLLALLVGFMKRNSRGTQTEEAVLPE